MLNVESIKEHMEVIGSDGGHVGKVDHIRGSEIELAKLDLGAGLKHHMIPLSWVDDVIDDKVRLNLTRDDAKARWLAKH